MEEKYLKNGKKPIKSFRKLENKTIYKSEKMKMHKNTCMKYIVPDTNHGVWDK